MFTLCNSGYNRQYFKLMFKSCFKYFKSNFPPPDLSSVLDFKTNSFLDDEVIFKSPFDNLDVDWKKTFDRVGLVPSGQWKIFELKKHPGLIIVSGALSSSGQRYWARQCLFSYTKPPNRSNLPEDDLNSFREQVTAISKMPHEKLRWVTMGYHHDWDTKVYRDEAKSGMPEEVIELCKCVSGAVLNDWCYEAQAVIVNYYYSKSTLSGHTDHSEPNQISPIISLSLGQNAIFLIGGKTLEEPATSLLIRSGDIAVMSGESRLCYHAVPKILPADTSPWAHERLEETDAIDGCLKTCRININSRQVLLSGASSL